MKGQWHNRIGKREKMWGQKRRVRVVVDLKVALGCCSSRFVLPQHSCPTWLASSVPKRLRVFPIRGIFLSVLAGGVTKSLTLGPLSCSTAMPRPRPRPFSPPLVDPRILLLRGGVDTADHSSVLLRWRLPILEKSSSSTRGSFWVAPYLGRVSVS